MIEPNYQFPIQQRGNGNCIRNKIIVIDRTGISSARNWANLWQFASGFLFGFADYLTVAIN